MNLEHTDTFLGSPPIPAAVLSSKLYEFEKQQSDIYVEKKLLTKRIEDMQEQVRSECGRYFCTVPHFAIVRHC